MPDSAPTAPATRAAPRAAAGSLRITEIFTSLQGEGRHSGHPTCFVRLTGCPLRCRYCDTAYAFHGGDRRSRNDILGAVARAGVRHVCVTGGEPLAQPACLPLLSALCDAGYTVSLETSGAVDYTAADARVHRVVDIKTPGSGEDHRNRWDLLGCLTPRDQIKFVITSRADYDWALAQLREHALDARCEVLFSAAQPDLPPATLADWMVTDRPPARFQVQLHKVLWGDVPGR